jgi:hypothetical protein
MFGRAWFQAGAAGVLLLLAGCAGSSNGLGPTTDSPVASVPNTPPGAAPMDPSGSPDSASVANAAVLVGSSAPGIVFGTSNMRSNYFNSVYTGAGRNLDPPYLLPTLAEARAKGARLVIKLVGGPDYVIQNADKTFSFAKWKALVDRYKGLNFNSYIADGTILGNYLIDEPYHAAKWGGKIIPQATVEAMAKYSKQLWPGMATLVRAHPTWLAQAPITYTYLDAGWAQYEGRGDVNTYIAAEIAAAKRKGLGLVAGLNLLDGGNGSSGIAGWTKGKWAMSATELRNYGTALLNQVYACGFFMWTHDLSYFGRPDIASAMAALSSKARAHAKTSCRQ